MNTVCGHEYQVVKAGRITPLSDTLGKSRIVVPGILHSKNGNLIKFKSLENAERHITNMGLAK